MKKLLILGSKGTLGMALIAAFQPSYEIFARDKEDLDITDQQQLRSVLLELQPDIIINATAINAVDAIEEDNAVYELAQSVNGTAVGNIATLAKELGAVLVHYSTDYIFDGTKNTPYTETDTPNPQSRYATTKLLGETLALEQGEKVYVIRLSRLFGKPGVSDMSKRSFVDTMIALSEHKDHLNIVDDQTGSPTFAPDLADFTKKLIEGAHPWGIYHGTNSGGCTWYEWAKKIFALKNISIKITPVPHTEFPRPAAVPAYSVLENTKLPQQRTWEEALEAYLNQ